MHSRLFIMGALVFALVAYLKSEVPKEKPLYPPTTVGSFTTKEVDLLRAKIGAMQYPLPPGSTAKLLPANLVPDPWAIYDWPGADGAGRNGGRILDYWLNQDYVLRVAQAYYFGDPLGSKDEWAVIIRSSERKTYDRTPYPFRGKKPKQPPEPTALSGRGSA